MDQVRETFDELFRQLQTQGRRMEDLERRCTELERRLGELSAERDSESSRPVLRVVEPEEPEGVHV